MESAERLWRYHCDTDPIPDAADLIIGLGSYDLRVADRCAELAVAGVATYVLFCGQSGHWTRDTFTQTEARTFANRAVGLGLPEDRCLLEETSTNTGENFRFAQELLNERGIEVTTAVVVAKGSMLRRARLTAGRAWPALDASLACPSSSWDEQPPSGRSIDELIEEMVGDLHRILIYPRLGFQEAELVPPDVLEAYGVLVDSGYGGRLLDGYEPLG